MNPQKYSNNISISGYRCNADRKKIQVRVEGATNVCKKLCYDDADCKGYYTKQPAHFNRNTVCNLCTGKAKNPILKRSSNVNDYNIIINDCDENYKLSEDGTKCIRSPTPPPPPPPASSPARVPESAPAATPSPPPPLPLYACPVNTYRLDNNCIDCPEGQIAPANSQGIEACEWEMGFTLPNRLRLSAWVPPQCITAPSPGKCGYHSERGQETGYNKCNRYLNKDPAYCDISGICREKEEPEFDRTAYNSDDTMCASLEKNHQYANHGTLDGILLYTEADFKGYKYFFEAHHGVGTYIKFEGYPDIMSFKKHAGTPITLILKTGECIKLKGVGNIRKIPQRGLRAQVGYEVRAIYFGNNMPADETGRYPCRGLPISLQNKHI